MPSPQCRTVSSAWLRKPLAVVLALSLATTASLAQTVPDAGAIRQQIEQPRELPMAPPLLPPAVPSPPEAKPQPGVTVVVKEFCFAGNTLLDDKQLAQAVAGFLNRPVSFEELQRAADLVAAVYREAGWIVRVYLPEQDVSAGVVTLQIVEARFGGLRFETELSERISHAEIEKYFTTRQKVGQALSAEDLDRALLLADDLPGINVVGTLVPGSAGGETELALKITDQLIFSGDVALDNAGSRATGSERLAANLNLNSPSGHGEQVSLNLLHSEGSDYTRLALNMPLGYDGLRLTVSASELRYKVIEGTGSKGPAAISGHSDSMGADVSYPLVRARMQNLYLSAGVEHKSFYTRDSSVRSDYASDSVRAGISGNSFDGLGGGGTNSASVQLLWGRLTDMREHALIDSIDRSYHKFIYGLSRLQTISGNHALFVSVTGQYADQVLDSSEKFYIGGAHSVRAYPVSELGGERGQVLTGEWRWHIDPTVLLTAFADVGTVASLATTPTDKNATLNLRGHGLSAQWQMPAGVVAKLSWSRRNGSNPRPTFTGKDGDGTLIRDRLWFSLGMPF